jgi:hypothetical protein
MYPGLRVQSLTVWCNAPGRPRCSTRSLSNVSWVKRVPDGSCERTAVNSPDGVYLITKQNCNVTISPHGERHRYIYYKPRRIHVRRQSNDKWWAWCASLSSTSNFESIYEKIFWNKFGETLFRENMNFSSNISLSTTYFLRKWFKWRRLLRIVKLGNIGVFFPENRRFGYQGFLQRTQTNFNLSDLEK